VSKKSSKPRAQVSEPAQPARAARHTSDAKASGRSERALEQRIARGAVAHYEDAAYYDWTYRRRRDDVRFYVELARRTRGPVLELGAGSGRVALEIARAGSEIVAVDAVVPMLKRLSVKAAALPDQERGRLRIVRGDLRKVRLRRRFSLVIAPFNVFMHLYTRTDLERALATVKAHLAPRGRFVFDVLMPDLRAMARTPARLYRGPRVVDQESGRAYHYFESFEYDAVRQVQLVSMIFQSESNLDELKVLPLSQRQFFPDELATLLHYNGFAIEARYGEFDRSPLADDSESQIVVTRVR
jgi:SAM-dependent methyltransferase